MTSFGITSSVAWKGDGIGARMTAGGADGATRAAERLKALAVPLAPLDLGDLRGSANVIPATAANPEAVLVFDRVYAAIQHEREDFQHEDGQAKYVEQPMREYQGELLAIMGKGVRVALR